MFINYINTLYIQKFFSIIWSNLLRELKRFWDIFYVVWNSLFSSEPVFSVFRIILCRFIFQFSIHSTITFFTFGYVIKKSRYNEIMKWRIMVRRVGRIRCWRRHWIHHHTALLILRFGGINRTIKSEIRMAQGTDPSPVIYIPKWLCIVRISPQCS